MSGPTLGRPDRGPRYDSTTILLHWLTAGLIAALWLSAQITDVFGRGQPAMYLISFHVTLGVLMSVLLAIRVFWRLTKGRSLPGAEGGWMGLAARVTHYGLYLLIAATLLLGGLLIWARGQVVWGLFTLPTLDLGDPDLRHSIKGVHGLLANIIGVTAAVHATAALFHHYILGDGILLRMVPARWIPGRTAADPAGRAPRIAH
jgi:cytochrome b561